MSFRSRSLFSVVLSLILGSVLLSQIAVQPALAVGTIYIRADGSIDPPDSPIQRDGDLYALTGNITSLADGIVIQRSNMTLDGGDFGLAGSGIGNGIILSQGAKNVTVKNTMIESFQTGILFHGPSTSNSVLRNTIKYCSRGIYFDGLTGGAEYNVISNNSISNSTDGIILDMAYRNLIDGNNVTEGNGWGDAIRLGGSPWISSWNNITSNNLVNTVTEPAFGKWARIVICYADRNRIYGNRIHGSLVEGIYLLVANRNEIYQNTITHTAGVRIEWSSINILRKNNITEIDGNGVEISNSNTNQILENNMSGVSGITLTNSNGNQISKNNVSTFVGMYFTYSNSSTISENVVASPAKYAVYLRDSHNNKFYRNTIINNVYAIPYVSGSNVWDDGYPSGGNYWNNYNGTDAHHGPNQDLPGSDGVGDTQYILSSGNVDRYPLMQPYPPQEASHDLELVSLSIPKTIIGQGFELFGGITVFNNGIAPEGIDFLGHANNVEVWNPMGIGYLPSGTQALFAIDVNTSVCEKGNNTITVYVEPVVGETDLLDNTLIQWLIVSIIGDVNGPAGWPDGKVDIRDLAVMAKIYGINYPDPNYNINYDLTGLTLGVPDGKIDIKDLALAATNYGKTDP